MRLSELIMLLQDILDECGEDFDPEVRLATQPSWPLAFHVGNVRYIPTDADDWEAGADPGLVWIASGESPWDQPYATHDAWD